MSFEAWNRVIVAGLLVALAGFLLALWSESEAGLRILSTGVAVALIAWLARRVWWHL